MKIENLSYEDAVIQLGEILELLEVGNLTLEQSLENYKKGILLHRHCNELLTLAEGQVKVLLADDKDILEELDFIREVGDEY
jgi:exodeoxyribonuclease VII small subunit